MEKPLFSFLFFWLIFFVFSFKVTAQQEADSVKYYRKILLDPQSSSDIPEAINYYTHLKEKNLKANNTYEAIKNLRMIAIGEFEIGNIFDSESASVEALEQIDASVYSDTLVEARKGLYNQLGRCYRSIHRYNEALKAYENALQFSRNQNDSLVILNNMGNIYKDTKRYQSALEQFDVALAKNDVEKNSKAFARLLDNKGVVQAKLGNTEVLINLQRALAIREREKDLMGMYSSYRNLALYYFDNKDTLQALKFSEQAYQVANTLNGIYFIEDALSLSAIMNEDPKMVRYEKITDSIATEKQLAQNKNAFIKYNVAKERKNTEAAKLENEKQKTWNIFIVAVALVSLVLAIIFYFAIRYKHRQEKITQVYTTEKRISKKVHDEVANDVYRLMAKLQSKPAENDEVLDDLESIYNKSRDISKENSSIDVENFQEVLSDLLVGYENQKVTVIRRDAAIIDWSTVSDIKKTNLYRVLQELMTNMAKHSEAATVVLNFDQKGKKVLVKYADNGIGGKIKSKNGLQNAESRIAAINGTITFESEPNKGFKATITI